MANTNKTVKNLKLLPQRKQRASRIYANYVEVRNNTIDISIKFCDVQPPAHDLELKEAEEKGYLSVPIEAEIALPRRVAEDLMRILQVQLKRTSPSKDHN